MVKVEKGRNEAIYADRQAGMSKKDIATKWGLKATAVTGILFTTGIPNG